MPILCHHLGMVKANEGSPYAGLKQVLESAKLPNIYIKLSGFAYATQTNWDFPYQDTHEIVRAEYEHRLIEPRTLPRRLHELAQTPISVVQGIQKTVFTGRPVWAQLELFADARIFDVRRAGEHHANERAG